MPDRVLVRPYGRRSQPQRGDIVAFRTPPAAAVRCGAGGIFTKRVIVLPRETWSETHGYVNIGIRRLREPYVQDARRDIRTIRPKTTGPDRYIMLGDNRASSCDSREWGTVAGDSIIGKVMGIYAPASRFRRF